MKVRTSCSRRMVTPRVSAPDVAGARTVLSASSDVFDVPPHVPGAARPQDSSDEGVELMEIRSERIPVLAELHPDPAERVAPDERADEGVEIESRQVHPRHPRGEGDEGTDDREQAPHEDGDLA